MKFEGDHNSPRPKFFLDSVAIFFYNTLQCEVLLTSENKIKKPSASSSSSKPVSTAASFAEVNADYLRNISHAHS